MDLIRLCFFLNVQCIYFLYYLFISVNKILQVGLVEKTALTDKLVQSSYAGSGSKVDTQVYYKVSRPVSLKRSLPRGLQKRSIKHDTENAIHSVSRFRNVTHSR